MDFFSRMGIAPYGVLLNSVSLGSNLDNEAEERIRELTSIFHVVAIQ